MVRSQSADGQSCYSTSFSVDRGVVQGDIFSPLCFIIAFQQIMKLHDNHAGEGTRLTEDGPPVTDLAYADDDGLLSKTAEEGTRRLTELERGAWKSATMVISKAKTVCQPICDYSHTNGPVSESRLNSMLSTIRGRERGANTATASSRKSGGSDAICRTVTVTGRGFNEFSPNLKI